MTYPDSVDEMLRLTNVPVVAIDQESIFTFINKSFEDEYGWKSDELIGKSVTMIMPEYMRSAHIVGFSRFLATETSELLNKPLALKIKYKNGAEKVSDHYIMGEKRDNRWRFSAIIDYPKADEQR